MCRVFFRAHARARPFRRQWRFVPGPPPPVRRTCPADPIATGSVFSPTCVHMHAYTRSTCVRETDKSGRTVSPIRIRLRCGPGTINARTGVGSFSEKPVFADPTPPPMFTIHVASVSPTTTTTPFSPRT